ncbi:MAG: hypothetical protein HY749_24295 [Gammaproteobacteria bacterium]|nr:hypothetical protein [Gammaproteobacteria bacterium]MBI5617578.1 hypothetical protein [Gammaproteobacteria bacterium]
MNEGDPGLKHRHGTDPDTAGRTRAPSCSAFVLGLVATLLAGSPLTVPDALAAAATPVPLVMLAMSRDEQYFLQAYTNYVDHDGDGIPETTYADSVSYYGYFHSGRCYRYDTVNLRFAVAGLATGANSHYCTAALDDAWSGNFLNWATMTRMDVVRKALYGGLRATDTATDTVLERAHLPTDGHSFAKYYNGADLAMLVPYGVGATQTATTPLVVDATSTAGNTPGRDDANEGITICNATPDAGTTASSQSSLALPLVRAVAGNYQLWGTNERWQCTWSDEPASPHAAALGNVNSNVALYSGIYAAVSDPSTVQALKTPAGGRDHVARVKVCEAQFYDPNRNLENCAAYGANLKPAGALQRYGLSNELRFGLVTGSYQKNLSGGVLRKGMTALGDEVDPATGIFIGGTQPGIVATLNRLRVWGYGYRDGTYLSGDSTGGENCPYQLTDIAAPYGPGEGKCASWGNPFSEIYLEALRYFAAGGARAPTPAFAANDAGYLAGLASDAWTADPLAGTNACASLNVVAINAGIASYDNDQTTLFAPVDPIATTNAVGDGEGITGQTKLVGRTALAADETCTPKTIAALGAVAGLCPGAPTIRGSYHVAGLAAWAHTHDLRGDLPGTQRVTTYGVPMAPNRPVIGVTDGAGGATVANIVPAYRYVKINGDPAHDGGGTLLDFRIVQTPIEVPDLSATTAGGSNGRYWYAKYYLAWDDSEQGADFDQDMWGTLEYHLDRGARVLNVATTSVQQGTAGGQLFGFVLDGTTQDGFHAYSGILGANYSDPSGVTGCTNCRAFNETGGQRGLQGYSFTLRAGGASALLANPLYYAAKWGGFKDTNGNGVPDLQAEWDTKDRAGNEVPGGDGIPDDFFDVANPLLLEAALTTAFNRIRDDAAADTKACLGPDADGDGVPDIQDNCTLVPNATQLDTNGDGYGNACDADLDDNGLVNAVDLAKFKLRFGTHDADADFDGNGFVNAIDLAYFKRMFGKAPGPSGLHP